jgi:hypothetical protein
VRKWTRPIGVALVLGAVGLTLPTGGFLAAQERGKSQTSADQATLEETSTLPVYTDLKSLIGIVRCI